MDDINRQDQAWHENNRMPSTFDEMCKYLLSQENCSIQGEFFTIVDLHRFCNMANDRVTLIKPELRNTNVMCTTAKRSMQKAFRAYNEGKIDEVGLKRKKPFSLY